MIMTTSKIRWQDIQHFDLEGAISEYGFATRLAYENKWSINFTQKAILEYKKFMFLAATSDTMVSPSEIIDIVWHQHLIFTLSYTKFAKKLGKRIEHIPSTSDGEKEKFKAAKVHTLARYKEVFGSAPTDIWTAHTPFDSLSQYSPNWQHWNIKTLHIIGLISAILLFFPIMQVVEAQIITISSVSFIEGFICSFIIGILLFYLIAFNSLSEFARKIYGHSFLSNLHPFELLYMKKGNLATIIHGITSQLIKTKFLQQHKTRAYCLKRLELKVLEFMNPYEQVVYLAVDKYSDAYAPIVRALVKKRLFLQTSNFVKAMNKKILQTKTYLILHGLHLFFFLSFALIGGIRLYTNLERGYPIFYLLLLLILLIAAYIFSFRQFKKLFIKYSVPSLYREKYRTNQIKKMPDYWGLDWIWEYFIQEEAYLEVSFMPVISFFDFTNMEKKTKHCGSGCAGGGACNSGGGCGGGCSGSCGGCGGGCGG